MNSKFGASTFASLFALPTLLNKDSTKRSFLYSNQQPTAQCASAEEEAAELQKIMESNDGGMPADPEEMQELLAKARGETNRKPLEFQRFTMPIKMLTMHRPNDGLQFSFMIPFSQRFQTSLTWLFSNKKAAETEVMMMLAGNGNMMDQDSMAYINANSNSTGRLSGQVQCPLAYGVNVNFELDMMSADPNMANSVVSFKKDFTNFHVQYQYQGIHLLNYVHSLSKELSCGFQLGYVPGHGKSVFSYVGKYDHNMTSFIGAFQPFHPQEKVLLGVVGRPSRRLNLIGELKVAPDNKTDYLVGARMKFQEGMVTGTMSSSGKATSVYKRFVEMFELTFTGSIDFSKPAAPAAFGLSVSLGGGM